MTLLPSPEPSDELERFERLRAHQEHIAEDVDASLAPATRRAYRSALNSLRAWAETEGLDWLAPGTLAAYLGALRRRTDPNTRRTVGVSQSSISLVLAAVSTYAREQRITPSPTDDPTVRLAAAGVRRKLAGRQVQKAHPLRTEELRQILGAIEDTPRGHRDAALIVLLFAGALRRSEAAGLRYGQITTYPGRGLILHLPTSKGDPFGRGQDVPVVSGQMTDPVAILERWLADRTTASGALMPDTPVFVRFYKGSDRQGDTPLSGESVNQIFHNRCDAAGLTAPRLSSHSGRRGHLTVAAEAGASLEELMAQGRHTNPSTTLGYVSGRALDRSTGNVLGL
ncbi:tyrosine-type recombinase/integrase [Leifsonia sp. L25]|uniref:tyrosine-type recombinase/integrase n=1 Tax=Actinomycetes TaxID=1760 RepID=UPI003D68814E